MNKKQFVAEVAKLSNALDVIFFIEEMDKLEAVLQIMGYDKDLLEEVKRFIDKQVTDEEYIEEVEKQAFFEYTASLKKVVKYMQMAKGYEDMAETNREISQDAFQAETEGESLGYGNEVGTENSEGTTKEA